MRSIFLIHRYLGIALGLLMAMWCISGIVMLYVPYPQLMPEQRLAGLAPLDWSRCCTNLEFFPDLDENTPIQDFQVEMLGARPVLRLSLGGDFIRLIDLHSGAAVGRLESDDARGVAAQFAKSLRSSLDKASYKLIDHDQWTVGVFESDRPLHWFALNDSRGTELYISSRTGKVMQLTTAHERFWSWLGAVPHWLYPTILRQHPQAWAHVVVWTSLFGTFLAGIGLYIGISQLRRRPDGGLGSPYRGMLFWHHVPGLLFGVFALTWVLSGCLSMNPFGLLKGGGMAQDRARLMGRAPAWRDVWQLIEAVPRGALSTSVSLSAAPLGGRLFAITSNAKGERWRLSKEGRPSPFSRTEISNTAAALGGAASSWKMLTREDTYHYNIGSQRALLPAIRIEQVGEHRTYFYLDRVSGALVDKADASGRAHRWWHSALHRLDFTPALRTWVARTFLILPLLIGAAIVCATGAYLGLRRLTTSQKKREAGAI